MSTYFIWNTGGGGGCLCVSWIQVLINENGCVCEYIFSLFWPYNHFSWFCGYLSRSVAAKIDFMPASILAAGKLSNFGDIKSTPLIFNITGHFVPEYWISALKIGRSLFALLESILPGDHKPLISNLCRTSYVGIQNCTMYSFFVKPTVNDSHSCIKLPNTSPCSISLWLS